MGLDRRTGVSGNQKMTPDTFLLNYGVLGLWTVTLLYEKKVFMTKLIKALDAIKQEIKRRR